MKKKSGTVILLSFVVLIWGFIGYRIVSAMNPEEMVAVNKETRTSFTPQKELETTLFTMDSIKRDPFLGTLKSSQKKQVKSPGIPKVSTPKILIRYAGFVKDETSAEKIYFVYVNSTQYLLKKGEQVEEIKLLQGNEAQITVLANGERISIKREH